MPRNTKIQLRRGSGLPDAADFVVAEPAWDSANGKLYVKNASGAMVEINSAGGGGGITYTVSSTAPSSPSQGDKWYNTISAIEFTYINDGTSSQWVDVSTSGSSEIRQITTSTSDPTGGSDGDIWIKYTP